MFPLTTEKTWATAFYLLGYDLASGRSILMPSMLNDSSSGCVILNSKKNALNGFPLELERILKNLFSFKKTVKS